VRPAGAASTEPSQESWPANEAHEGERPSERRGSLGRPVWLARNDEARP